MSIVKQIPISIIQLVVLLCFISSQVQDLISMNDRTIIMWTVSYTHNVNLSLMVGYCKIFCSHALCTPSATHSTFLCKKKYFKREDYHQLSHLFRFTVPSLISMILLTLMIWHDLEEMMYTNLTFDILPTNSKCLTKCMCWEIL